MGAWTTTRRFRATVAGLVLATVTAAAQETQQARPTMGAFMGLNVHTVKFKPDLYKPVTRTLRDYHPIHWDLGDDTDYVPQFPLARNRVSWEQLYGNWTQQGYRISACAMLGHLPVEKWKDLAADSHAYGKAFASFFGPGGKGWVEAIEIGNEPGDWPDARYRTLFENMAKGVRAGDPKLKIATCAATAGPSHKYAKNLDACFGGLQPLFDIVNLHSYPQVEGWPTWRRSYPEDPTLDFLKDVQSVIAWRDRKARGKSVWLTEFGYDSSTKPNDPTGNFAKWQGVTDLQQARYIVRAWLVLSTLDLDRAYLYWFDDDDTPHVHAAAGLTRHYQPKPSFHAVAHLYAALGDYRFEKALQQERGGAYVFSYAHATQRGRRILVAWSATGSERTAEVALPVSRARIERAEAMPLAAGAPPVIALRALDPARTAVPIGESPVYLWVRP